MAEYGSPHGGSWLSLLTERGMSEVDDGGPADVVLDCFGMMHCPDQGAAVAERAQRVAPGGVLLLQFHSLATILRHGQWNSLRHGHFAYYSASSLKRLLTQVGFTLQQAWQFDLYGGTTLVAATRDAETTPSPDTSVDSVMSYEQELHVCEPEYVQSLRQVANRRAQDVRHWLAAQRAAGWTTLGYGAASRAVALLCRAGVDSSLLPCVADASPAKQGRRMPGTDIPVVSPNTLVAARPKAVLLFLSDLMAEVRRSLPHVEQDGGQWVDVEALPS